MSKKTKLISELNDQLKSTTKEYNKCLIKNCKNSRDITKFTNLLDRCNKKFKNDKDKRNGCFTKGIIDKNLHLIINNKRCASSNCGKLFTKTHRIQSDIFNAKYPHGEKLIKINHEINNLSDEKMKCEKKCELIPPFDQLPKEKKECNKIYFLSKKNMSKFIKCRKKHNIYKKIKSLDDCKEKSCINFDKKINLLEQMRTVYRDNYYSNHEYNKIIESIERLSKKKQIANKKLGETQRSKQIRDLETQLKAIP